MPSGSRRREEKKQKDFNSSSKGGTMERIDLNEFCGGSLRDQFSNALSKVLENCMDRAASAKEAREITVKVKFAVTQGRDMVVVGVQTATKLAREAPATALMGIGARPDTGEIVAEEFSDGVKGQSRFDPETGEIFEERRQNYVMPMPARASEA